MAVGTEIARLKRAVVELAEGVAIDLRSRAGMSPGERRALKVEIEQSMQTLDELRTMLTG